MSKKHHYAKLFYPSLAALLAAGCSTTVVKNPEMAKAAPAKPAAPQEAMNENPAAGAAAVPGGAAATPGGSAQFNVDQAKGMAAAITPDLRFETGSAQLPPKAHDDLQNLAVTLTQTPSTVAITIEGHTDNTGPSALNEKLSQERADAVKSALVANGVAPERISTIGHSYNNPMADNASDAGRAQNRRAEILIG
jgi:outer membrane protein OmpA-like peptidoglycan-associated protein